VAVTPASASAPAWDAVSIVPTDTWGSIALGVAPSNVDATAASPGVGETTDERQLWTPPRRGRGAYRPGTVPTALAVGLGALALVASVLAIVFALAWSNLNATAGASSDAKNVAAEFLRTFTNFQPNTIEVDFNSLQRLATGSFSKQATQYFGSPSLRRRLEGAGAQSTGRIRSIYVESLNGDRAQVYAVVDQTYTNAQIKQAGSPPVPDVLRLQINLAHVSGTWKISDATVLSGPSSTTPTGGQQPAAAGP
jgi:hypothetical protein